MIEQNIFTFSIKLNPNLEELQVFNIPTEPFDYDTYWNNYSAKIEFTKEKLESIYAMFPQCANGGIVLNDENAKQTLALLEDLVSKGIIELDGAALSSEDKASLEFNEWFELDYHCPQDDFDSNKEIPNCIAYNHNHITRIVNRNFVTEKFKSLVEQHQLTGLEFIWVPDRGKYKARQWYQAIATEPIGRGIDHPWYDRKMAYEHYLKEDHPRMRKLYLESLEPKWKQSPYSFTNNMFKSSWTTDSKLCDQLISLFIKNTGNVNIYYGYHFDRKHLPKTDFAYNWHGAEGLPHYGRITRWRYLYANKKAAKILVDAGIINLRYKNPIKILDEVPEGIVDLHNDVPMPSPIYIPEELAELKSKTIALYEEYVKKEMPIRNEKIAPALTLFRKNKTKNKINHNKGNKSIESARTQLNIPFQIPEYWKKILEISDGFTLDVDEEQYRFTSLKDLANTHYQCVQYRKDCTATGHGFVYFGSTIGGDYLAFRKKEEDVMDDCAVALITHDEDYTLKEWASIPNFLMDILLGEF